ncbi:MAG: amino acid ABC transporter substrate-binding protein [Oscillospiraceae bacterium]|nr:amino acid ABC transporter substrate-binding protein [Oscillospiraceae bacterium]
MKKLIALTLALVMALGMFAACGNTSDAGSTTAATTEGTEGTEGTTEPAAKWTTVTEGKLTMATNAYFPPYEYYDGDKIIGIDAEIAEAIAKELGLELVISDMQFDSIITAVKEGSADFGLAGMTITEDRLLEVDFSISYASGVQSIIVKEGSPITKVDDLYAEGAAYKVGVQLGTTGDIYCTDDFGEDLVTQYTNGNEAVTALLGGDIDCVIIDNEPAKAFVAANEGLKILDTSYADEDYAACFAQDNDALKEAVDAAILKLTEDGTIDAIIDKYIK